jgi:hypothetical protein
MGAQVRRGLAQNLGGEGCAKDGHDAVRSVEGDGRQQLPATKLRRWRR